MVDLTVILTEAFIWMILYMITLLHQTLECEVAESIGKLFRRNILKILVIRLTNSDCKSNTCLY